MVKIFDFPVIIWLKPIKHKSIATIERVQDLQHVLYKFFFSTQSEEGIIYKLKNSFLSIFDKKKYSFY